MQVTFCFLLSLLFIRASAQETHPTHHKDRPPYHLDTPAGWGTERFPIPMSFAPSIAYKGAEDIRFTPGWGKRETGEYWSYVFLWYLEGSIALSASTIEKDLSAYYTGLLYANLDSARRKTIRITPATVQVKAIEAGQGAERSFAATVQTLDFLTWQPLVLHLRIHSKTCTQDNATIIFHEVSPKPFTDAVWKSLHALWISLRCSN